MNDDVLKHIIKPERNIFTGIPKEIDKELFQEVLKSDHLKIERIVSNGQCSPQGFWYDQKQNEWVLVLQGSAGMLFDNQDDIIVLKAGDYLFIPSGNKHRVEWTDSNINTIWLAIFFD
ncbi:MAG: cupin domain-containing protein [Proteobacteria bacterium]|nr:cupin domain-containing protein [Pseudomonadota bacterium]